MTDKAISPFSIFIPTWNNLEMLKLCIESIEKNSAIKHEFLIHVNDGSDGTLEWLREKGYKYSHSEDNIGVCWAMNSLRPMMTMEYLMFINDDMYMCPGWDTALFNEIEKIGHNRFFLASSTIQRESHKYRPTAVPVYDFGKDPETFREKDLLELLPSLNIPDTRGSVWPPNLVHRDMWDLVGGYSVEYSPGMGSDPDFAAKLWMAGIRYFKTSGKSICYHFMSASVSKIVKNRGEIQFLRKWGLTVRAFLRKILKIDTPFDDEEIVDGTPSYKIEHFRSTLKKYITIFKNPKTKQL